MGKIELTKEEIEFIKTAIVFYNCDYVFKYPDGIDMYDKEKAMAIRMHDKFSELLEKEE